MFDRVLNTTLNMSIVFGKECGTFADEVRDLICLVTIILSVGISLTYLKGRFSFCIRS